MTTDTTSENRDLPPALAERFADLYGLDEPPTTLDEWAAATADRLVAADVSVGVDELCTAGESRHEARIDGDPRGFHCVLDALLVPFVIDGTDAVEIRSESPAAGEVVELESRTDGVSADPETAVVSIGVDADAAPPETVEDTITAYGHETFCPYANAFPDEAAYEEWDAATPEALTMAVPVTEAHRLMQRFGDRLA